MVQKTIQDYYDAIHQEYPGIPESDIKRILLYGWKSLYLHNSYGGDVLIHRQDFWFYCGHLMNDSIKFFDYYKRKLAVKLRIMYKRKHIEWDGYYYFALSRTQYEDYLKQKHHMGRPRKKFTFDKVMLYQIYDECSIVESNKVALFRVPTLDTFGFTIFKENWTTDKAEFISYREPLKFQDILLSNYQFEYLNG